MQLTPDVIQISILVWQLDLYHNQWLHCDLWFNITVIVFFSPSSSTFSFIVPLKKKNNPQVESCTSITATRWKPVTLSEIYFQPNARGITSQHVAGQCHQRLRRCHSIFTIRHFLVGYSIGFAPTAWLRHWRVQDDVVWLRWILMPADSSQQIVPALPSAGGKWQRPLRCLKNHENRFIEFWHIKSQLYCCSNWPRAALCWREVVASPLLFEKSWKSILNFDIDLLNIGI